MWTAIKKWWRHFKFRINPVNGTLLTVNPEAIGFVKTLHPHKARGRLHWPSSPSMKINQYSSFNHVFIFTDEVEEFLNRVGAYKMIMVDFDQATVYGTMYKSYQRLFSKVPRSSRFPPPVQGLLFIDPSDAVEFKLRFM